MNKSINFLKDECVKNTKQIYFRNIVIGLSFLWMFNSLLAQVTPTFLNDFEDGTLQGWQMGGSAGATNISSGGPLGADDNYMQLAPDGSSQQGKLVVLNTTWTGNYTASWN